MSLFSKSNQNGAPNVMAKAVMSHPGMADKTAKALSTRCELHPIGKFSPFRRS